MVASQLRTDGVADVALLEAMRRIPRETFVPVEHRAAAYSDRSVPLADGRALNPPVTTARLIDAAKIDASSRVLIVGAASGYALAVVAGIAGSVVGVESDGHLADLARAAVPTATVVLGSLAEGAPEHGPYDAIVVDGAVEAVPDGLIAQLAPAGRLTAAVFDRGVARLSVGRRGGSGFSLVDFADAEAVALPGFARPKVFAF